MNNNKKIKNIKIPNLDIIKYKSHYGVDLGLPDGTMVRFADNINHLPTIIKKENSMKDEIKEILDKLQKVANCETASRNALMKMPYTDYQLLLDYITNLQEELEEQKRIEQASLDTINNLQEENEYYKRLSECYKADIQTVEDISAENLSEAKKEIERLKTTLKGTTHCFDEEEHKRLKDTNFFLNEKVNEIYDEKIVYKSRNEKAIEYIKGWQSFPHTNGSTHNELRNLLNILQGSDKDE